MNATFPLYSIFVRYSGGSVSQIQAFLDALSCQSYRNFEIILLDVPLKELGAFEALTLARGAPRIVLSTNDISSVSTLDLSRGEYFFIFEANDLLCPDALQSIARELDKCRLHRMPDVIIFDYRVREGQRQIFLPGWDPDLIQYNDYIQSAACFSANFVRRISKQLLSFSPLEILQATDRNNGSVLHVAQTLLTTKKRQGKVRAFQFDNLTTLPISIIIPNKDGIRLVPRCLQVFKMLTSSFEIIVVDNASQDPRTWQMYQELEREFDLTILPFNRTFNYSAMINRGVDRAHYDFVLLLNNDVFIDNVKAIVTAVNYASRAEVGVVGSVLRYFDGGIQHAGMVLSRPTPNDCDTTHVLRFEKDNEEPHTGALTSPRNWLSVTGAFQVMRKAVFEEVRGYDEVNLPIEFNDVDFCLRVRARGLRVVCLPLEGIVHDESQTRSKIESRSANRFSVDAYNVMCARWEEMYDNDPYYNAQLRKAAAEETTTRKLRTGLFSIPSVLRALGIGSLVTKDNIATTGLQARAEMPLRLRNGICIVAPLSADVSQRPTAIVLGRACKAAALDVSFYDCSSTFVAGEIDEIPIQPFPDQLVTLYVGKLSGLECDRYSLGEGRTRILVLCDDTKSIRSGAEEYLKLFDQIWTFSGSEARKVQSLNIKSALILPSHLGKLFDGNHWAIITQGRADPIMEIGSLGIWIKSAVSDLI